MFLWPDMLGPLDKLTAAGGNYTRCLMSGRLEGKPLWPFFKDGDRYDLNRWDDQYWRCFEQFLKATQQRRILTDIELWATFDYARLPWTRNPFNPVNNGQYTTEQTGLAADVKVHRIWLGMFFTIPYPRSQEATERFWRNIFAGCASVRFHEKHLGDSEPAQRMIRSARAVTRAFDLFHCAPHNELLLDRAPNQAYCLDNPGKE